MAHSRELIQSILDKVQESYPADQFDFVIEQAISGSRMFPDIQVKDRDGKVCCAVEIGYTRPEKLTAYRNNLKIPDVRWYDKLGNLHADVQERVVRVSIQTEPQGRFVGYALRDEIPCWSDECVQAALFEAAGLDIDKYSDWHDAIDDVFKDVEALGAYDEYLPCCTLLTVVTDLTRVWLHLFCDKSGESEWVSKERDCQLIVLAAELTTLSGREFAQAHDRRRFEGGWAEAMRFADKYADTAICYQDGEFLSRDSQREFSRIMTALRMEAISA
jgi:hypothetical protein